MSSDSAAGFRYVEIDFKVLPGEIFASPVTSRVANWRAYRERARAQRHGAYFSFRNGLAEVAGGNIYLEHLFLPLGVISSCLSRHH